MSSSGPTAQQAASTHIRRRRSRSDGSPWQSPWYRWRQWAFYGVPATLAITLLGIVGCCLAPKGGALESASLVLLLAVGAVIALCVLVGLAALAFAVLRGPWEWVRQRGLDGRRS